MLTLLLFLCIFVVPAQAMEFKTQTACKDSALEIPRVKLFSEEKRAVGAMPADEKQMNELARQKYGELAHPDKPESNQSSPKISLTKEAIEKQVEGKLKGFAFTMVDKAVELNERAGITKTELAPWDSLTVEEKRALALRKVGEEREALGSRRDDVGDRPEKFFNAKVDQLAETVAAQLIKKGLPVVKELLKKAAQVALEDALPAVEGLGEVGAGIVGAEIVLPAAVIAATLLAYKAYSEKAEPPQQNSNNYPNPKPNDSPSKESYNEQYANNEEESYAQRYASGDDLEEESQEEAGEEACEESYQQSVIDAEEAYQEAYGESSSNAEEAYEEAFADPNQAYRDAFKDTFGEEEEALAEEGMGEEEQYMAEEGEEEAYEEAGEEEAARDVRTDSEEFDKDSQESDPPSDDAEEGNGGNKTWVPISLKKEFTSSWRAY